MPGEDKRALRRFSVVGNCSVAGALALLPVSLLLSGCAAVVVGALGGAGALTYRYAATPKKTTADTTTNTAANIATDPFIASDAPTRTGSSSSSNNAPAPAAIGSPIDASDEAAENPGSESQPNTASQGLQSTVANGVEADSNNNLVNPFAAPAIEPAPTISLNNLTLATTFTVQTVQQQVENNHSTTRPLP